jgi:PD-(D/E)XK nuclease superfamily
MEDVFALHESRMKVHLAALEKEGVKVFKVSTTEREEFKACRRKWDYASLSRQGIEPKRAAMPLWFGTGVHEGLEHYYKSEADPVEVFDAWAEKSIQEMKEDKEIKWDEATAKQFDESCDLGRKMLENYVTWASIADYSEEIGFAKVLYTEREFQVPILDGNGNVARFVDRNDQEWEMHLVGRLDLVVEDFHGRLWLLDHKTTKDKLDPETLVLNDQMVNYLWAVQQIFGRPFEGVYYNALRKKVPTVPPLLKNGKGLSKAKLIDSTPEVYMQAIEDNDLDPDDYTEILEHLRSKPNTFFQREKLRRNQYEIKLQGYLLYLEAIDMLNDPFIYPNMTWNCKYMCDYKELCKAESRGDDTEWLRTAMYRKRKVDGVYDRTKTVAE